MFEDVADFGAVQLGIDRHGAEARLPNPIECFEIGHAMLRNDCDAVAGFTDRVQRAAESRNARGKRAIIKEYPLAEGGGRTARMTFSRAFEPQCKIHRWIDVFPASAIFGATR